MRAEEKFDKIEAYLFGSMTPEERTEFEAAALSDIELQTEINLHELEHQAMQILEEQDLKAQFAAWKTEKVAATEEPKIVQLKPRRSLRRVLSIAASVLIVMGVGLNIWVQTTYSNDGLGNAYRERTSLSDRNMGSTNPLNPVLDLMAAQQYEAAITAIEALEQEEYRYVALKLKAESYMQLEDFEAAIATYRTILSENPSQVDRMQAEYLLGLALLQNGESEAAKVTLATIAADETHTYQAEAQALLTQLDSFWRKLVW